MKQQIPSVYHFAVFVLLKRIYTRSSAVQECFFEFRLEHFMGDGFVVNDRSVEMGPWSTEEIGRARQVPFIKVLDGLGAYYKRDADYHPVDPARKSAKFHVNHQGRDFRFIFTGEKWVNELLAVGVPGRGGGGAIDLVQHLTGCGFVQSVKICLDAVRDG